MKWEIKPERPHPDKIEMRFAFLPRLLYLDGKAYKIWFGWYYVKLVWRGDNAWSPAGYIVETEFPYFNKRIKR